MFQICHPIFSKLCVEQNGVLEEGKSQQTLRISVHKTSLLYKCTQNQFSLLYKCKQNQFTVEVYTKPVYCTSVHKASLLYKCTVKAVKRV